MTVLLEAEHRVGRAPDCALKLAENYVSGIHALLRWERARWTVIDLKSKNGTFVDGARLGPDDAVAIGTGTQLSFGVPTPQWILVEDGPPQTMLIDLHSGMQIVLGPGENLFVLPTPEHPTATIFVGPHGQWLLELGDEQRFLRHGDIFAVEDRSYRWSSPDGVEPTIERRREVARRRVQELTLRFILSSNVDWVVLEAQLGPTRFALENRAHDPLLALLATARLDDVAQGMSEDEAGWRDTDSLAERLGITGEQINLLVFRARRYFESIDFADAAHIIERKPRHRRLRIGLPAVQLVFMPA